MTTVKWVETSVTTTNANNPSQQGRIKEAWGPGGKWRLWGPGEMEIVGPQTRVFVSAFRATIPTYRDPAFVGPGAQLTYSLLGLE